MVGLSSQILWLSLLLINLVSNVLGCDFPIGRWTNVDEWNGPGHTNCKVQTWDGKVMYNKNITKEEIAWGIQDLSRTTECVYTNADATVLCMFEHFAFPALGELPTKPVFFNYFATQTPNGVAIRFVSGSSTIVRSSTSMIFRDVILTQSDWKDRTTRTSLFEQVQRKAAGRRCNTSASYTTRYQNS